VLWRRAPDRPSLKPIPLELGDSLRDIGDPELRAVLESLARSLGEKKDRAGMKLKTIVKAAALVGRALLQRPDQPQLDHRGRQTADGPSHRQSRGQGEAGRIRQLHLPALRAFTREADDRIKLAYVTPGNVSLEVRHLIRDPVDLTAVMLANCGRSRSSR
jgi:hypothetical protein